ncbi:unnamed protein product [Lepeophtheirus salmonis]|uniref:(salmon louse) hypothetical protein n=1 Tax=Lepeophtheirus salmonis TaxID=72036 RepID=A0A7R8CDH3_LEPSM|nr:unnamed protein product [Lepeophtheirus salmonis]CAF2749487.1 unnamed protein product [Lepeophtheirus salmonis]
MRDKEQWWGNSAVKRVTNDKETLSAACVPKRFGEKGNLTKHVKTVHERRKAFQCVICEKTFGEKGNLQRHVKAVHHGKKDFRCAFCGKEFAEKGNLQKHIKAIHEPVFNASQNSNPHSIVTTNLSQNINNHPPIVQIQIPLEALPGLSEQS